MIALTRRCKLHQPFLIRRVAQTHYDYSRRVSLESARAVIRMKEVIEISEDYDYVAVSAKHTGVVFHIFMATIVLVMDLCFNKAAEGEDDSSRKAEVIAACRMLEASKSGSTMANEFLESLMDVLRKYKVRLHNPNSTEETSTVPNGDEMRREGLPFHFQHAVQDVPVGLNGNVPAINAQQQILYDNTSISQDNSQPQPSDFDEIWQTYVELGPSMDMPDWDSLFSDLDAKF
jgi:hypothetical protein